MEQIRTNFPRPFFSQNPHRFSTPGTAWRASTGRKQRTGPFMRFRPAICVDDRASPSSMPGRVAWRSVRPSRSSRMGDSRTTLVNNGQVPFVFPTSDIAAATADPGRSAVVEDWHLSGSVANYEACFFLVALPQRPGRVACAITRTAADCKGLCRKHSRFLRTSLIGRSSMFRLYCTRSCHESKVWPLNDRSLLRVHLFESNLVTIRAGIGSLTILAMAVVSGCSKPPVDAPVAHTTSSVTGANIAQSNSAESNPNGQAPVLPNVAQPNSTGTNVAKTDLSSKTPMDPSPADAVLWSNSTLLVEPAGQPINLLKLVDLARDVIVGEWQQTSDQLIGGVQSRLYLPVKLPEDYQIKCDVRRLEGPDTLILGFVMAGRKGMIANIVRHSDCSDLILWRQRRLGSVWGWRDGCQDIACLSAVCDRRSVERLGSRRLQSSFGVYQRFFAASSSAFFSFARCASTSSVVAQPIMWKQIIS